MKKYRVQSGTMETEVDALDPFRAAVQAVQSFCPRSLGQIIEVIELVSGPVYAVRTGFSR